MECGNFLALDGGNTRLKGAVMDSCGRIIAREAFSANDAEGVLAMAERYGVERGAMSAVGHFDPRLPESLRHILQGRFLLLGAATELPVGIEYATPLTLGIDRKMGAAGAAYLWPGENILIADAGTALTLDLIDAHRGFIGGNISAGLSMRLKALHEHTARLPLAPMPEGELPDFALSTEEALQAGALGGLVDEVAMSALRGVRHHGVSRLVLTGGDAPRLHRPIAGQLELLGLEKSITLNIDPDLLFTGLWATYRHHEHSIEEDM